MTQYYSGTTDIYYATMSTEDSATAAAVYGTPKLLGASVGFTITPRYKEGKLYASNKARRNEKRLDGYDVSLNPDQIEASSRKEILGRAEDANKVQILKGTQVAPYVAIGFGLTKDGGDKELWWIYKGKFSEMTTTGKTEGDSIEYQTPTIEGVFDRRIYDDKLAAVVDSGETGVSSTAVSGWFSAVYEETTTPPSPGAGDNPSSGGSGD